MQMKKLSLLKMVQLTVLILLTAITVCLLFNSEIKQFVFSNLAATILFVLVWIVLITCFIFLLLDFSAISSLKLNYHNLYEVAFSDPLSGIPNRFSCDVLIEKYIDKHLPDDIGCVVIDLINLADINTSYDHATGNTLLMEFSTILTSACTSMGFVGRNGGNKFLAIFEECDEDKANKFLTRISDKVEAHNASAKALPIQYRVGSALNCNEDLAQITKLIALANNRAASN